MESKVVFWDFDGTLVYPDAKWSGALHTALSNLGYDISMAEVRQHLHTGYTWHKPEDSYVNDTGSKWWDNLFEHFNKLYVGLGMPRYDMDNANKHLREQILNSDNYTLYDDTVEILRICNTLEYKNYILSNNFPELSSVIEGLGLSDLFSGYVVSANIGYEKPRVEIFQYALKMAGQPSNCYMIGDNPIADIKGGKAAGMSTILVHNNATNSGADFSVSQLKDILAILKV